MKLSEIKSNWSLLNYFIDLSNFDGFVNLNITADRQDIKERVDTILRKNKKVLATLPISTIG